MKDNGVRSHSGMPPGKALVGVDIGGTKTAVVVSTHAPEIAWRKEFPTLPTEGPEHAVCSILELVGQGLRETHTRPSALGVSCGGPLDRVNGVIQRPPNLPSWDNVEIKRILEDRFAVPCHVENDANAGAIAEHRFGAGQGCRHMVFLTLGTGLGAGLILNGNIYHGANGMAGEIGHVRLTESGPSGFGKSGSVEGWASGGGMAQRAEDFIRSAVESGVSTSLTNGTTPVTARDVGLALADGDPVAERIVHDTGVRLGEALAILVDLLNPERIVLGGLALRLGDSLLGPARVRVEEEALRASSDVCEIVPAALGERIGDVAALCVALGLSNS